MLKDLISAQGAKTLLDMGLGTTIEETIVRYVFQNPQDPNILDALELLNQLTELNRDESHRIEFKA